MSESDQGLVMKPLEGDENNDDKRSFVSQDSLLEEEKGVRFRETSESHEM